jgi:hypothetical protein
VTPWLSAATAMREASSTLIAPCSMSMKSQSKPLAAAIMPTALPRR